MSEECIAYVCLRPDHHRRQASDPRLTTYRDCCAFCPADAADGHDWTLVPNGTFEAFEALGWIPRGSARRCRELASAVSDETASRIGRIGLGKGALISRYARTVIVG